jgi:hypothetical protein
LLFQLDPEPLEECVTAYGGIPLFPLAVPPVDVPGRVNRHVQIKRRQRGPDEAGYAKGFLVLNALGGDCLRTSTGCARARAGRKYWGPKCRARKRRAIPQDRPERIA